MKIITGVLVTALVLVGGIGSILELTTEQSAITSLQLADPGNENLVCYEYPNKSELVTQPRFTPNMVIEFNLIKPPMTFTKDGVSKQVEGLTLWYVEDGKAYCRIFGPIPKHVNGDPHMDTLGHEFLHCIIGSFHAE